MLQNHCHVGTAATVHVETDSSTVRLAEKSCVTIRSEELEPAGCSTESGIDPLSHVSMKHKTEDEEKSLCSQQELKFVHLVCK